MGDPGSIPRSGRFPGVGIGNPLQYSCLGNPMDRGARWITAYRVTKNWTQLKQLSIHAIESKVVGTRHPFRWYNFSRCCSAANSCGGEFLTIRFGLSDVFPEDAVQTMRSWLPDGGIREDP